MEETYTVPYRPNQALTLPRDPLIIINLQPPLSMAALCQYHYYYVFPLSVFASVLASLSPTSLKTLE